MAVQSNHALHRADADAEVSSCVSNLIEAFTNGLNIFKRLRERRRKRKARKENQASDPTTSAELQLSKSLRKGPQEIADRYAECYHSGMGARFAKGDSIAHASLAETLIKLNTGLVGIIATFLNYDHKSGKSHMDLDYKSLTNLSNASRREALHSMAQLYQRLSHSQLQLSHISTPACSRCGSINHVTCSGSSTSPEKGKKKHHTGSRQKSNGPVITRMPTKSSIHSQLVVVRPKNTRKSSRSSNSSGSAKSPPSSSTHTSPVASPLPKYVVMEPFEIQTSGMIKGTLGGGSTPSRRRVDTFDDPKPSLYMAGAPEHLHYPTPKLPSFTPTPRRKSSREKKSLPTSPPPACAPIKRRIDKATPSSYTFASDSTKLGEIPQRHWTKPWDYEEAERLNAEVVVTGQPAVAAVEEKSTKKKGLRRFLRRESTAGVSA